MNGSHARPPSSPPWPSVEVNGELARARAEWLHTNGAGAYASSTVAGLHTRRYHGLLVAALDAPAVAVGGRYVFVSHVDAIVTPADTVSGPPSRHASHPRWDLAKHQFPGVDPEATPLLLKRYDQDPLPRWTHSVAGGELEVTLGLVRRANAIVLRYIFRRPERPEPVTLALRPLLATRSHHELLQEHGGMLQRVELRRCDDDVEGDAPTGEMRVQPRRDLPRVCFRYEGTFVGSPDWWRRFEYLRERDRGLPFQEDLWTPGIFEVRLSGSQAPRYLIAAVDHLPAASPAALLQASAAALLREDPGPGSHPVARRLTVAAETFRVDASSSSPADSEGAPSAGVMAGYPFYGSVARDTWRALPGLYLATSRVDDALALLVSAEKPLALRNPPMEGGPAPDSALWKLEAARLVALALGPDRAAELLPMLREILETIEAGAGPLRVTRDGLIATSAPLDGGRSGCAIELTALWTAGCDATARIAHGAFDGALEALASRARDRSRAGFPRFWCAETDYPFDLLIETDDGLRGDSAIRANAVVALAADPDCFSPHQADAVLARARASLLTPAGLRTLAPWSAGYAPRYASTGGADELDGARAAGTVWPWLVGAFVRASRRRGADPGELAALVTSAAGNSLALGHVAELADAEPPHLPHGATAHALAVAELLRALVLDLA